MKFLHLVQPLKNKIQMMFSKTHKREWKNKEEEETEIENNMMVLKNFRIF